MTDIAVFCGRFRPFHLGHLTVVQQALEKARQVFIVVGSVDQPVTFQNPFTFGEVREMIRASLTNEENERVLVLGVQDHDTDTKWVEAVQREVTGMAKFLGYEQPKISLIGFSKDASSYYLKLFPQWGSIAADVACDGLSATMIRKLLYSANRPLDTINLMAGDRNGNPPMIPMGTMLFLREWVATATFDTMRSEAHFMADYLQQFSQEPYPRPFVTADACVILSGQVLLVRRAAEPGRGLWALPGGHVGMEERFKDAAIRELYEETSIGVEESLLRLSLRAERLLDDPWRSTRKRTIGMAYGFHLQLRYVPDVEGADDAVTARWWPINEVTPSMMFEDHYLVVRHFADKFSTD